MRDRTASRRKQENRPAENRQPDSSVIREWDNDHVFHPWASLAETDPDYSIIRGAEGIFVHDAEGRRYIDGPGGMWCVNIGYGRQEIADAIAEQAMALNYASPWTSATEPSAILARRIAEKTPADLNHVFFTTDGSSAVDTAIRFTHFYNNIRGRPEKKIIIAREKGYHGSSYLAASLSGKERDRRFLDVNTELVRFIGNVNPYIRPDGMTTDQWCQAKLDELEAKITELGAGRVAAFIAEPVLASGGVIIPPEGYHKGCLEICRRHDVLYISDEVVTGFGRLGHWFASESVFGITPDIITCAKGLTSGYVPMGAAIFSDALLAEIRDDAHADILFSSGYTYSGHPVSAAAALKNMDIIEDERILDHVRRVTPHFQKRLQQLGESFRIVGDARGMGLLGCLEGAPAPDLPEAQKLQIDHHFGARMDAATEKRGLLVRPIINMCVFSPPLIISEAEIDSMFDILGEALAEVEAEMLG